MPDEKKPSWRDNLLPTTNKDLVERFNSADDLVEAYAAMSKAYSGRVSLPKQEDTQDVWNAFYARVGMDVPGSAEGYTPTDDPILTKFKEGAHGAGMNSKAWDAFSKVFEEQKTSHAAEVASAKAAFEAKSKEKYGAEYETVSANTQRYLDKIYADNPDLLTTLETTGLKDHPIMHDLIGRLGDIVGQDKLPNVQVGDTSPSDNEPKALAKEGREIYASDEWKDRTHIANRATKARLLEIQKKLATMGFNGVNDKRLATSEADLLAEWIEEGQKHPL